MKIKYRNKEYTVKFTKYYYENRLAAYLYDEETSSQYGVFTVNIIEDSLTNKFCAFIDTNNWEEQEFKDLENIGKFTGNYGVSGFCTYPEFEFKKELVEGI